MYVIVIVCIIALYNKLYVCYGASECITRWQELQICIILLTDHLCKLLAASRLYKSLAASQIKFMGLYICIKFEFVYKWIEIKYLYIKSLSRFIQHKIIHCNLYNLCLYKARKAKERWAGEDLYLYNYKCIGQKYMYSYLYIQFSLALYKHKRILYICVCKKAREARERLTRVASKKPRERGE